MSEKGKIRFISEEKTKELQKDWKGYGRSQVLFVLQQLLYNIISDLICQELFNFSFRSDLYCSDRSPSATFIDYHIWSLVSRSFFILFRSQISSDVIFSCRSFSDVDYLTIDVYSMSTTFFLFFTSLNILVLHWFLLLFQDFQLSY